MVHCLPLLAEQPVSNETHLLQVIVGQPQGNERPRANPGSAEPTVVQRSPVLALHPHRVSWGRSCPPKPSLPHVCAPHPRYRGSTAAKCPPDGQHLPAATPKLEEITHIWYWFTWGKPYMHRLDLNSWCKLASPGECPSVGDSTNSCHVP